MTLRSLLPGCALLVSMTSVAAPVSGVPERLMNALRDHDQGELKRLISEDAAISILWSDSSPPQRFTLSKAEYLQQYRAVWRFGGRDSFEFGPVRWVDGGNPDHRTLLLRITERRTLFGNPSGQRSDVEASVHQEDGEWRIDGLKAVISLW